MIEITDGSVTARVALQGGMVTTSFLVDGQVVQPLYEAPWLGEWSGDTLLAHLQGDFVCVPFGMPGHGYAANNLWALVERRPDAVVLEVAYPGEHAVERVTRTVRCVDGAVEFVDAIDMRHEAALPLGLHPIFRLPATAEGEPLVGAAFLELPEAEAVLTPPEKPEPASRLLPGKRFTDVWEAPSVDGTANLTRLPWEGRSEDLVMLANVAEGRVGVVTDGHVAVLEWDTAHLKHCLLWISNRGRDYEPWNGRNLCLGVEAVTSAFDWGVEASAGRNEVADEGFETAVRLGEGRHELWHRIRLER
ncbi:MAG: hypothetical protein Q4G70_05130 [Pseudomonadota bacterium]|nr:hypothetical protein [Pseudomonadota bacterium]